MQIAVSNRNELLIVLEPGNIDQMQIGKPFGMHLPEGITHIVIAYTPDSEWVSRQLRLRRNVIEVVIDSLGREEVHKDPFAGIGQDGMYYEIEKMDELK